jgi:hypothetical protein
MTTLGSPLLGWPSSPEQPDGGLSIFPGGRRPVDLALLGAWTIRLTVGADDSAATTYDVDIAWQGDEPDSKSALEAVLDHLAIRDPD